MYVSVLYVSVGFACHLAFARTSSSNGQALVVNFREVLSTAATLSDGITLPNWFHAVRT